MKKLLAYSLLATFVAYGCQVKEVIENTQESQPEAKVFTAVIEDNTSGDTKTSLDGEGNVLWKQGDQVSIFAGSTVNEQYQVSDDSDGKTAATLNKIPAGGFVAGGEIDNNVAFYPYASTAEIAKSGSNYVISEIELPATQTYAAGSFGNGAFPMATVTSSTEDMNLKFKNVLGGLKLQLKGTATITSITVTGNNDEILCGDAEVTTTYGGVPSIVLSDASAKTVTLDCGAGVTLDSETATPFIIALPPITMTGGFTVVVTDTEGKQMEIKTTKPQTITRSNLLKMPAVNYVGEENQEDSSLKFTSTGSTSISLIKEGSPADISLEYKVDNRDWRSYTVGDAIDLTDGQELSFRAGAGGNSSFSQSTIYYYYFEMTGSGTVAASGNIMSLLNNEVESAVLTPACFSFLFWNCAKLTSAPELPATTLASTCYSNMFRGCGRLTSAPELPATTLANYCYNQMFFGCTSLTTAPELPATTLADYCYDRMFRYCANLTSAPELPATVLTQSCYARMFWGCSNLNYIKMLATDISASDCLTSWVDGVSATGTFVKSKDATWDVTGVNGVPSGWTIETPMATPLKFTSTGSTSISLTKTGSPADITLDYKVDDGEWASYTVGDAIDLTDGQDLSFRAGASGNSSFSQSYNYDKNYHKFTITGSGTVSASGNIMSLLDREGGDIILSPYCFYNLFSSCTALTTAPELPATTLADYCYYDMFNYCIALTTAPALPATSLAKGCYASMFYRCTALTTAPELPATTLAQGCYASMFYSCSSLISAPELPATTLVRSCYNHMFQKCTALTTSPELPATSLADYCYSEMFNGCTALTTAPELPATTLASDCYYFMFNKCSSLTSAPELPATTLASNCYSGMFWDCTSLSSTPELPATTLVGGCYSNMFNGCNNVNYIKALFTSTPGMLYTSSWLSGVAATGTFVKSSSATWDVTGTSGVPSGWTIETE